MSEYLRISGGGRPAEPSWGGGTSPPPSRPCPSSSRALAPVRWQSPETIVLVNKSEMHLDHRYTPVNVNPRGAGNGGFWQTTLGIQTDNPGDSDQTTLWILRPPWGFRHTTLGVLTDHPVILIPPWEFWDHPLILTQPPCDSDTTTLGIQTYHPGDSDRPPWGFRQTTLGIQTQPFCFNMIFTEQY